MPLAPEVFVKESKAMPTKPKKEDDISGAELKKRIKARADRMYKARKKRKGRSKKAALALTVALIKQAKCSRNKMWKKMVGTHSGQTKKAEVGAETKGNIVPTNTVKTNTPSTVTPNINVPNTTKVRDSEIKLKPETNTTPTQAPATAPAPTAPAPTPVNAYQNTATGLVNSAAVAQKLVKLAEILDRQSGNKRQLRKELRKLASALPLPFRPATQQ